MNAKQQWKVNAVAEGRCDSCNKPRGSNGTSLKCRPCADKNNRANLRTRRRRFGLEYADYLQLVKKQNGLCAICGNMPTGRFPLVVDHDHRTGKVRKLLCTDCNLALGRFQDSVEVLGKAIDYLLEHRVIAA